MFDSRKILIVVAGIFGSGKSTFINHCLKGNYQDHLIYLLPDEKVQAYGFQQGTPAFHHQVIQPMIEKHLLAGNSLLYETTLTSTKDKIEMPGDQVGLNDYLDQMPCDLERMVTARKLGYTKIILYYLSLGSPQKNNLFVKERVQSENGVPIAYKYIENRYRKSLRNLPEAAQFAHHTYLIDNSQKNFRIAGVLKDGKMILKNQLLPCFEMAFDGKREIS